MTTADDSLAILERLANGYPDAARTVLSAAGDEKMPQAARRLLVGALNYALDQLDIFPDHYRGIGVADDAMVIRLAAKQAIAAGAVHAGLRALANDTADVAAVLDELMAPLERYVAQLSDRKVRGLTTDQTLSMAFESFAADVEKHLEKHPMKPLDRKLSAEYHVGELRRMMRNALQKAGLLEA